MCESAIFKMNIRGKRLFEIWKLEIENEIEKRKKEFFINL